MDQRLLQVARAIEHEWAAASPMKIEEGAM
jgi:hypothetical protein